MNQSTMFLEKYLGHESSYLNNYLLSIDGSRDEYLERFESGLNSELTSNKRKMN